MKPLPIIPQTRIQSDATNQPGLTGSVSPVYAPGMSLSRAGVVAGLDLTTEAALTKMSYLLALPDSTPEWVAKKMSVSLRGELTEVSQPVFRHPDGALPERVQSLTVLGYAIAQGDLERVEEIVAREHQWLLNDADYSGNTPIVRQPLELYLRKKKKSKLTPTSPHSTSQRHLPQLRFSDTCCSRVAPCTCETAMVGRRCSWRPTQDSRSTCCCYASLERICTLTNARRRSCWPGADLASGGWRGLGRAR